MKKLFFKIITCLIIAFMLSACADNKKSSEQAQQVLTTFFSALSNGNYDKADKLYGGSYETLVSYNPLIDPNNHTVLWKNGCEVNGLNCLEIRTATFNELTSGGEYIFTVEFSLMDGSLFVLEGCCGENSSPPKSQFVYRVISSEGGVFKVLDMPVYIP